MRNIQYSKQAKKFLSKQTAQNQKRLKNAIDNIPLGDIKKLKGKNDFHRLRVGDFRIIFTDTLEVLYIIDINNRGDVYKRI